MSTVHPTVHPVLSMLNEAPLPLVNISHYHKDHLGVLGPYVAGKLVVDIGCGVFFNHAWQLRMCGARRVIGIDKEPSFDWTAPVHQQPEFEYRWMLFSQYDPPSEPWIAYVSWPVNWNRTGLVNLVDGSRGREPELVVYRGKCTDGTMCGDDDWWCHVRQLEVLSHVPRRAETLIVYGSARVTREPLLEELAATSAAIMDFDEQVPESTWLPLEVSETD